MGVNVTEFESFEQQFLDLVGEFQTLSASEGQLRESIRAESSRAESALLARDAAERAAADARAAAAAAAAGASQAAAALAGSNEELTALKMQLELTDRQHKNFEERCLELSLQISVQEREIQQLRPIQSNYAALQKQYVELQARIRIASEEAKSEASRLEAELRRVERSAAGGAEVRERARLAAAAHAREKRLANAELKHTNHELLKANAEISRLNSQIAELRHRYTEQDKVKQTTIIDPNVEALSEVKATLEAERAGTARLERALAAALADNATLAARMNTADNNITPTQPAATSPTKTHSNVGPIESFLAD